MPKQLQLSIHLQGTSSLVEAKMQTLTQRCRAADTHNVLPRPSLEQQLPSGNLGRQLGNSSDTGQAHNPALLWRFKQGQKLPAYLCLTETIWLCLIFGWSCCKHLALESMSHRSRHESRICLEIQRSKEFLYWREDKLFAWVWTACNYHVPKIPEFWTAQWIPRPCEFFLCWKRIQWEIILAKM